MIPVRRIDGSVAWYATGYTVYRIQKSGKLGKQYSTPDGVSKWSDADSAWPIASKLMEENPGQTYSIVPVE